MSEQFGWSEWIEFKAGVPCPITWAQADQYEVKWDADDSLSVLPTSWGAARFWRSVEETFHYRYSLSAAPAGFVPPGAEKPWVPGQVPGFGPWVEWNGDGLLPIGEKARCQILVQSERLSGRFRFTSNSHSAPFFGRNDARDQSCRVVAYCVKLEDQPTTAEIEATQTEQTAEADEIDRTEDEAEANQPMHDRDWDGMSAGKWARFNASQAAPTAAPTFMVRDVRSSDGLLTVREADHRLGQWS